MLAAACDITQCSQLLDSCSILTGKTAHDPVLQTIGLAAIGSRVVSIRLSISIRLSVGRRCRRLVRCCAREVCFRSASVRRNVACLSGNSDARTRAFFMRSAPLIAALELRLNSAACLLPPVDTRSITMVTWLPSGDTISLSCTICEARLACGAECAERHYLKKRPARSSCPTCHTN